MSLRESPHDGAHWIENDSLIQIAVESREAHFNCWIDVSDNSKQITLDALNAGDYYFKANFNPESINSVPQVAEFRHLIGPISPGFTQRLSPLTLAQMARRNLHPSNVRLLLQTQRQQPRIGWLRRQRTKHKKWDAHFVATYYPTRHDEQNEFRLEVMERLQHATAIHAEFGFYNVNDDAPSRFKRFAIPRTSRRSHLSNIAQSRAAVYVQGPHRALSFKFGEHLALGVAVIGQQLANNTDKLMALPYFEQQYFADSPRELVSVLVDSLKHPDRLLQMGTSNANTFDTLLSPHVAASNVLQLALQETV